MSNLTITPEERAELREECRTGKYIQSTVKFADFKILRLLTALEAAEAQRDKALQMNAERQVAITETALNALLAGITGEEKSVGLNVAGYHCPYCGEISKTVADATAHDATCPKHPAVVRATKAEAEMARLTAERDWLVDKLADISDKMNRSDAPTFCAACNICPVGDDEMEGRTCAVAIEEAARRAVAGEGEVRE